MVINTGIVDSKFVVGCYKLHKDFFFLVFIVDYNHCALNSRPSKQAIEARTLKIRKERLGQASQAKQKLSALTQLQGKQCSAEEAA